MITIELKGADEAATKFKAYPDKATRALVRAMNRGIKSAQVVMVKGIAGDTGFKQSDVKLRLRLASATRQEASLGASTRPIPLIKFKARGPNPSRGRGVVTYQLAGQRVRVLNNAFIATMRNGHDGVFVRTGSARKSHGAWSKNLPIKQQMGPSLGDVFKKFRPAGIARANEVMAKNLTHELAWNAREDGAADA